MKITLLASCTLLVPHVSN